MRAKCLSDILKAGDRVAVSNITGREAAGVTVASQKYCNNIVGGWALGKGGQNVEISIDSKVPVYATFEEMVRSLPEDRKPNKIIVYSPPAAVYSEIKDIVSLHNNPVETIFVVTEHVSVEVTAKISEVCKAANIDVVGCNSLGVINTHDGVRVGAVGSNDPANSFKKGSATIISNSGNMVNTMASYLLSSGMGTAFGISTGKDMLIQSPLKNFLELARDEETTKLIIAYLEPGGIYEKQAVEMMVETKYPKPVISYITGEILQKCNLSLGHAGAVVEGKGTSATDKMELFDEYYGIEPFDPSKKYEKTEKLAQALKRGIRITSLHHLPAAAGLICDVLGIERDFKPSKPLSLNPWFVDYKGKGKKLPSKLVLHHGVIPKPYCDQVKQLSGSIGANPSRRDMRNASHCSSNDGATTCIYGNSVEDEMRKGSFIESVMTAWLGEKPQDFEVKLLEKCFIAALTNGPGTISAQGAKLSTSAGNDPNTAMIATLACIGNVHGGNGRVAVEYLIKVFNGVNLNDPYNPEEALDLQEIVNKEAERFNKQRNAAKDAGVDYQRIPCLGHPVFRDKPVNYDPRERIISEYLREKNIHNIFLEFYHQMAHKLKEIGVASQVWAVNVDGAIASVVLATCWKSLVEKRITLSRVCDLAFMVFALGRVAGGGGEYLDHKDFGSAMDMRIPVSQCKSLTRSKDRRREARA
ncbi:MAG: hypothetical protein JEZ07_14100 [Phycisphaerae bacterium]|nr:hypothetical protein [Phycisphaerae bacterium]